MGSNIEEIINSTSGTNIGATTDKTIVSPYFLHPSDNTGQTQSPILLNGDNYERWAKLMMNSLRSKRKVCFLNGTLKRPSNDSIDAEKWDMVNSMIIGWIYSSIEPRLRPSVSLVDSAKLMWDGLQRRFSVNDGTRDHQLRADLASCKQDGQSVEAYFGKLKVLWDDLADFDVGFKCCCGDGSCAAMVKYQQHCDKIRVHQFLMGLDNTRFGTTRSNLLSRESDLNLDKVYSQIVQEERHLNATRASEDRSPAVGFSAMNQPLAAAVRASNKGVKCLNCGKVGHEMSSCFQIHGYPEWWTEKSVGRNVNRGRGTDNTGRGRGRGSTPRANNVQSTDSLPTGIPSLTPEQWSSLATFMNQKTSSTEKLSGKRDTIFLYGKDSRYDMIIDSGASHHMTGDDGLLSDIVSISPCPIKLPNGDFSYATKQGTLNLGGKLILHNVFLAPHLTITLISVAQLLRDIAGFVLFTKKGCVIQDQHSKTLIGAGEARDGVYHYMGAIDVQAGHVSKLSSRDLWHRRLGHPSSQVLSFISDVVKFKNNVGAFEKSCDVCIRAKHTRDCFHDSSNKAEASFSLIHCDVWGPYRTKASCGSHYFLTIVDDFSRAVWTILLLEKSDVASALKNFITFVERQFEKQVKVIRSDNGTEFTCLRSYFRTLGIIHQTSCVATPQQNGRVERKHRHILNVARALLFQVDLPIRFWGESILAATYLINRTPSVIHNGKSPYEILMGISPDYSQLRVFGSLCFARKVARDNDKFQERSIRCLFLGYEFGKKGWIVYDLKKKEKFVSRDVIFQEEIFPFTSNDTCSTPENTTTPSPTFHPSIFDDIVGEEVSRDMRPVLVIPEQNTTCGNEDTTIGGAVHDVISTVNEPVEEKEQLGRGKRQHIKSVLLEPYITYSAQCVEEPSRVSVFSTQMSTNDEPLTYEEAAKHDVWLKAVGVEVVALEENETWDITTLPPGKHVIGCKWVFKIKYNSDGSLERHKARLVALGNRQKEGLDFTETFAPVVKMTTLRIVLAVASAKNWELHQMDVHNAFLHGDLDEEVYMRLPPGFSASGENKVCKLRKSLYGLRQAPRCWFAKLSTSLLKFGFVQNHSDYSLFTYSKDTSVVYVLVYVDDLVIGGNDSTLISKFKTYLSKCFHMKDLGPLKYFLGIEVSRGKDGIYLCQRKYALDVISESGLVGEKSVDFSIEQNHGLAQDKGEFFSDPGKYRRLVGRLVYLVITRPELSYVVHILAQFMQAPRQRHWEAALRVVRYLKGSPGQGILLSSSNDLSLSTYCDSDWASCPLTRRPLTGYVFMLGDSIISWKTKKQPTFSSSSTEAEYRAMALTYRELKWVKSLLQTLGVVQQQPTPFYCDNQSVIRIAKNPVFHERTKHIEVDCHQVREGVLNGEITTKYVKTTEQLADILTKALGRQQFQYLLRKLGVRDLHSPA